MKISDAPRTKTQFQVTDRYCATGMSLSIRAVPATSPTNELYNACASSFRTKQWNGPSARPNRQTVTHSVEGFESGVRTCCSAVERLLGQRPLSSRHDFGHQDSAYSWWVWDRLGVQPPLSTVQEAGLRSCLRAWASLIAYSGPKCDRKL
jgi:hypothetical protein